MLSRKERNIWSKIFRWHDHKYIKSHWKRPWCCKDWRQKEKGATEDEMVGWRYWLNGHEFEQTLRDRGQEAWVLQPTGLQRVKRDLTSEQQQQQKECKGKKLREVPRNYLCECRGEFWVTICNAWYSRCPKVNVNCNKNGSNNVFNKTS